MKNLTEYNRIRMLKGQGLQKAAVARQLRINRRTVDKYWDMSPDEYQMMRHRVKRMSLLDDYQDMILDWMYEYPGISAAKICDRLNKATEHAFAERTVSRYMRALREETGIRKTDIDEEIAEKKNVGSNVQHVFGGAVSNRKNKIDGMDLLKGIEDRSIAAVFFDPQYRGLLDFLNYGNEGVGRGKARCDLPQMTEELIIVFLREINRVIRPSGHCFLWIDKFHLMQSVPKWIEETKLHIVDMITWEKGKLGMGWRSRRKSEYLVVLQKTPRKAKGCWNDHTIPDVWREDTMGTHPHSKPIGLEKRLIEATTQEGDIVLDPAAGGYSVMEACKATGRVFIGGDLAYGDELEC